MGRQKTEYDKTLLLYELYEQKMYAVAYSILGDKWQAEDAVSESFIKIIKNLNKIKDEESDKTKRYIIRIIQNTAIDLYRRNQKERSMFTVASEENEDFSDMCNPVEAFFKDESDKDEINELLSVLPEIYQQVFVCRCLREMSTKETADYLKIGESLIRKRYERAKEMLAKKLGDEQYECKVI